MGEKLTILIVDDSRLVRVAARKVLGADFDILEAGDGEQAWSTLQGEPHIALLMSDLSMPNLDGLSLLQRIRQADAPGLSTLPVIIVTGAEDDDGSKQAALAAGASDFITKPFNAIQLLARVRAQARQRLTQQALQDSESDRQQLARSNHVDTLTGLANEARFREHLVTSLSFARRHGTELALLLLRVDKYKAMFLRYGKEAAEAVLGRVAQILEQQRRCEDLVARTELDTFAFVLPATGAAGAGGIAARLRDAIRAHAFTVHGESIPVSASIALAELPPATDASENPDLLQTAEQNLHEAIMAGGNRIHPCPPGAATDCLAADTVRQTAGIADVERALRAIAAGRPPTNTASLVQAVVPLLQAWNREHDNRHSALIEMLEAALAHGHNPAASPIPAGVL
jgi:two-component system cell cycle response regulator